MIKCIISVSPNWKNLLFWASLVPAWSALSVASESSIQEECSALLQTRNDRPRTDLRSEHLDYTSTSLAAVGSESDPSVPLTSTHSKRSQQDDDRSHTAASRSETGSRNMHPLSLQQLDMHSTEELVKELLDDPPSTGLQAGPYSKGITKPLTEELDFLEQNPVHKEAHGLTPEDPMAATHKKIPEELNSEEEPDGLKPDPLTSHGLKPEDQLAAAGDKASLPSIETVQDVPQTLKQAGNGIEAVTNSSLDTDLAELLLRIATVNHQLPLSVGLLLLLVLLTMIWVCLFLACHHTKKHYQRQVYGHGWDQA